MVIYCAFCEKSSQDTLKVIAGRSAFICNECVDLCCGIILEEHGLSALPSIHQLVQSGELIGRSGNRVPVGR